VLLGADDDTDAAENQGGEAGYLLDRASQEPMKPVWKSEPGIKGPWYGDLLIKKFNQPAKNQERVLDAFQKDDWNRRTGDPMPRGRNPKRLGSQQQPPSQAGLPTFPF
jgi:hypothetical protein